MTENDIAFKNRHHDFIRVDSNGNLFKNGDKRGIVKYLARQNGDKSAFVVNEEGYGFSVNEKNIPDLEKIPGVSWLPGHNPKK